MIYLVHGEDLVKSRLLILNQQKKYETVNRVDLDLTETTPNELFEKTHGGNLFGDKLFLVLDISGAGRMNVDAYVEVLKKIPSEVDVVILSNKTLSSANAFVKNAGELKAKIIVNEKTISGNVFRFADAVFNKQRDRAYQELEKLLAGGSDPFEIFNGLVYGLRSLAGAKFNTEAYQKAKGFIQAKTQNQKQLFSDEAVKTLYRDFSDIDREAKSGVLDPQMCVTVAMEKVLNS
jgi:DNA polymerase III delta subunit